MSNEIITLVKDTSLARIIALQEIIWAGQSFLKGSQGISGAIWPLFFTAFYYLLFSGVLTLLLPHPLAQPFAYCAEWCASLQNSVVEWFASLPFASIQHTLTPTTIAVYYSLFVLATIIMWSRKPRERQHLFALSEFEEE